MSQLNIWSYELPDPDIADMARHAENFIGNVIGWSDFYDPADAGIKKVEPSAARDGKLSSFSCHVKKTSCGWTWLLLAFLVDYNSFYSVHFSSQRLQRFGN